MAPYLATAAGPLRGPRRMLHGTNAAVMANMPKYYIASRRAYYPLCTTQHDEGQVLSGNDAAIAAWRWNTGTTVLCSVAAPILRTTDVRTSSSQYEL